MGKDYFESVCARLENRKLREAAGLLAGDMEDMAKDAVSEVFSGTDFSDGDAAYALTEALDDAKVGLGYELEAAYEEKGGTLDVPFGELAEAAMESVDVAMPTDVPKERICPEMYVLGNADDVPDNFEKIQLGDAVKIIIGRQPSGTPRP